MRTFKKVLNGKGLLAASIAMLSGHALAETAGRVSFVSGDAAVTGRDGSSRALKRGDAINGGDRISTRAGRVQIRFTDGGFVSLQPNTVFGVDEYLYANRKPEETSLFFSLVQGGMRTITGAIGKVNKKSYQVRTPVATIGIRGTEYLAQVDDRGLVVSVGHGFVNVANQRGDITAGARQNIRVTGQQAAPVLTEEKVELLSTRTDGRERRRAEDDQRDRDRRTVTISDVQSKRGDYLFLFTTTDSLADSVVPTGPEYKVLGPSAYSFGGSFYADFDQSGAVTGTVGGLQKVFASSPSTGPSGNYFEFFDSGTLKVVNSGTIGAVSWGEYTNGDTGTNNLFSAPTSPLTLSDTEFMAYIVGTPSAQLLPRGFATYSLQGATPARDAQTGEAGTVDQFIMRLNLDYASLDAFLRISMPTNTYTVSTLSSVALSGSGPMLDIGPSANALTGPFSSEFNLYSYQLGVTDSNGACAGGSTSSSCYANISGFFAGPGGTQIATSYSLSTANNSISGVAALGLSDLRANAPYLPDSSAGVDYLIASPSNLSLPLQEGSVVNAFFDKTGEATGTIGGLRSLDFSATVSGTSYAGSFDAGSLKVVNSGTLGALSWGEFTDGSTTDNTVFNCTFSCTSGLALDNKQFVPYVVGVAPIGNLGKGTAVYTLQGKTPVRDSYLGRTGTLNNFVVKLNLDFATVEAGFNVSLPAATVDTSVLAASVSLPGNTYTVQTNGPVSILNLGTAPGFSLNSEQLVVTDANGACGSGSSASLCYAGITAFFAGEGSKQIGASYWLDDVGSPYSAYLSGVAALGLSTHTTTTTLNSGSGYSLAFAGPQFTGVAGGFLDESLTVNFDTSQLMTTATGFDPATSTYGATIMDRQTAQAADTGQVGALKWGRWYTTGTSPVTVTAGGIDLQVASNEALHYIVGPMTQPGIFAGIVQAYGEGATATYTYQGGSFATANDGTLGRIADGSTLTMTFSSVSPTLALDLTVDMQSGNDYDIGGVAQLGLDATASKFSAITGSGASCTIAGGSAGCSAQISGFFAGQQAQQIGLGYRVDDGSRVVNGTGAFGRGAITGGGLF
jgi:hypothetical protein